MTKINKTLIAIIRLSMSWLFIWGFFDKTFGLGFPTATDKAWIVGGSPTFGFLKFATYGPLAESFQKLAGLAWVDWLFMLGLLLIGLSLLLGIGVRIAGYSGALMMILMWLSLLPPADNPVINQHIIYALILLWLAHIPAGEYFGMGRYWKKVSLVEKYKWLK